MKRWTASDDYGKKRPWTSATVFLLLSSFPACNGTEVPLDPVAQTTGTSTSDMSTVEMPASRSGAEVQASAAVAGRDPGPSISAAGASAVAAAGSGGAASPTGPSGAAGAAPRIEPSAAAGSGGQLAAGSGGQPSAGAAANPATCDSRSAPVVYVIGDSTASVYEADLYPRMGWAQPLQEYFRPGCAQVQDKALSGRSSKSFFGEGAWTPIRSALHEGDFVLIQFGHNDEKRDDPARYTEPFGSYQEHLSMYVDDTLAAGATPILLTPIERNKWSSGKLSETHGEYPEAVRQLAQMRKLSLVDMTALTHAHLEDIGQSAASKLFMNLAPGEFPNYPNGNSDDTHLQDKGAHVVAEIALAELARQASPLAALLEQ